jgi:octaprenyl-diphosphate synthase
MPNFLNIVLFLHKSYKAIYMSSLKNIRKPVEKELKEFEQYFSTTMKSDVPLIGLITNYILRRKGKMMRPLLVFLSARVNGEITPSTHTAAAMIELLHTATLVHDDVIDESYMRRGFLSINALWRSKIAVLMGDFLLSKGMLLAVDNNEHQMLRVMSNAVKEMIEGELLQIQKARKLNITEDLYFDIIRKKTATLISCCTECGALSVEASNVICEDMRLLGENLGIAFQIRDDILDYELKSNTGKPSGNDLQEKKLTLPLIHALNVCTASEKKKILHIINHKIHKKESVEKVHIFVKAHGGIEYAVDKMKMYKEKAAGYLANYADDDIKNSFSLLLDFVVDRKK